MSDRIHVCPTCRHQTVFLPVSFVVGTNSTDLMLSKGSFVAARLSLAALVGCEWMYVP